MTCKLFAVGSVLVAQKLVNMVDADLPPLGVAEILPVVGMLVCIIVVLAYGMGCIGSSPTPAPADGKRLFTTALCACCGASHNATTADDAHLLGRELIRSSSRRNPKLGSGSTGRIHHPEDFDDEVSSTTCTVVLVLGRSVNACCSCAASGFYGSRWWAVPPVCPSYAGRQIRRTSALDARNLVTPGRRISQNVSCQHSSRTAYPAGR